MDTKVDKFINLSMQIAKTVAYQTGQSLEEKAATMLQFHSLSFLKRSPECKSSELARQLNASLSSTTQLVDRMDKLGLLKRKPDKEDRRVTRLLLTTEGEKTLQQMKEMKRKRVKKMLSHLEVEDVDSLIRIQEKLLNNMKKETKHE